MNKTIGILTFILAMLFMCTCAKKQTPVDVINNNDTTHVESSPKKGACFATNTSIGFWATNIAKLQVSWYYTWGTTVPTQSMPLVLSLSLCFGEREM